MLSWWALRRLVWWYGTAAGWWRFDGLGWERSVISGLKRPCAAKLWLRLTIMFALHFYLTLVLVVAHTRQTLKRRFFGLSVTPRLVICDSLHLDTPTFSFSLSNIVLMLSKWRVWQNWGFVCVWVCVGRRGTGGGDSRIMDRGLAARLIRTISD